MFARRLESSPRTELRAPLGGLIGALFAAACAVPPAETGEDDPGETRGLVVIERNTSVDEGGTDVARAFAGFVSIPSTVSADRAMKLLRLAGGLPETGLCTGDDEPEPRMPLSPLGQVEFVEAGEVTIEVMDIPTELSPRAFPSVTDLISGLVYSTRTRANNPLPADALYSVRSSGSSRLERFLLTGDAPRLLTGLTVNGVAFEDAERISTSSAITLGWEAGQPGDVVVVEVSTGEGEALIQCGFADEQGSATMQAPASGAGRLVLHRVRTHAFPEDGPPPAMGASELRFDFARSKSVHFER